MSTALIVTNHFDRVWPLAADHLHRRLAAAGPVAFHRLAADDQRAPAAVVAAPAAVTRLALCGHALTAEAVAPFTALREVLVRQADAALVAALSERGVRVVSQPSEGYWGQSVAECGLALTLGALRRIPQLHRAIISDQAPWEYEPPGGIGAPGARGIQFGDDARFAHGTVHGKRVRVIGCGNIGARYASFCAMLGAEVAAWDPLASEAAFHRAGARREWHLERLVADAQILAPMMPLVPATRGLLTAALVDALPRGCLVVLVTRAGICDMAAIRRRVLADELALAADVFDVEPLPLGDPLLGRHNVVHTPHLAGRTQHANHAFADAWADQLADVPG